ncbi:electron transfer flavoprotein subunit alpha/FixB family protein [Leucothrix arctica]|uniref:Electron transfer flavoprotein subunit alpha n=1 Tax=Leucothrix arctica TaxID=1481894 RepID=A0A317CJG0_9GAMM|nr:FAD-binding protein [Leucothrix arctica]PWQ98479.1 electron transfer flavoprotein subunit alpha [Leucothrix arctica]
MSILVVAEHDNASLISGTLSTLAAAKIIGGDITVLVAGENAGSVVTEAQALEGVSKVLVADNAALADGLAENIGNLVSSIAGNYSHVLTPASNFGKNFMPRVAAKLDVMQVSDIVEVVSADTFVRPIYAGNALMTVKSNDTVKLITVRSTAFDAVEATGGSAAVEDLAFSDVFAGSSFISRDVTLSERPELGTAKIVVSGGRGVGSKENFAVIEGLAEKLNAAVGASRAAVDLGYAPNDCQVGQTGKVVAPEIYFAIAISGAIQHQAGMSESKIIVAINKDADAPIFNIADYGIVGDLFDVVPELMEVL